MSNAIVTFEVEGVKHSLYFGMVATEIISGKSIKAFKAKESDNIKAFAYIIYGGLCNSADSKDIERPPFETAYFLSDAIASDNGLTGRIYAAWTGSKPYAELKARMDELNGGKKKAPVRKPKKTGAQ